MTRFEVIMEDGSVVTGWSNKTVETPDDVRALLAAVGRMSDEEETK